MLVSINEGQAQKLTCIEESGLGVQVGLHTSMVGRGDSKVILSIFPVTESGVKSHGYRIGLLDSPGGS